MKNPKQKILFILLIGILTYQINVIAQDTFSIVAVDTITGEIGSAGASVLDQSVELELLFLVM